LTTKNIFNSGAELNLGKVRAQHENKSSKDNKKEKDMKYE